MRSSVYDCSQLSDDECSLCSDGVFTVFAVAQTLLFAVIHMVWGCVVVVGKMLIFLQKRLFGKRVSVQQSHFQVFFFLHFCSFEPNLCGLKFPLTCPVLADICFLPLILRFP